MLIRLFSTDEQVPQEVEVKAYANEVLLQGQPDFILPQYQALYSTVRNRGSFRVHCMLRLFVRYGLKDLDKIDTISPSCLITWKL